MSTYDKGLQRYDGINLKSYTNNPSNPNSLTSGPALRLYADADNIIWIATIGTGLDRFDPATNSFTHFRHNPKDASSLSNDTVACVSGDRSGNIWVGTFGGLDLLDKKTGKFTHYRNDSKDPASINNNHVFEIVEDKKGLLWIYGATLIMNKGLEGGGLNRFDRTTGKFTRISPVPGKPQQQHSGKINFEDL